MSKNNCIKKIIKILTVIVLSITFSFINYHKILAWNFLDNVASKCKVQSGYDVSSNVYYTTTGGIRNNCIPDNIVKIMVNGCLGNKAGNWMSWDSTKKNGGDNTHHSVDVPISSDSGPWQSVYMYTALHNCGDRDLNYADTKIMAQGFNSIKNFKPGTVLPAVDYENYYWERGNLSPPPPPRSQQYNAYRLIFYDIHKNNRYDPILIFKDHNIINKTIRESGIDTDGLYYYGPPSELKTLYQIDKDNQNWAANKVYQLVDGTTAYESSHYKGLIAKTRVTREFGPVGVAQSSSVSRVLNITENTRPRINQLEVKNACTDQLKQSNICNLTLQFAVTRTNDNGTVFYNMPVKFKFIVKDKVAASVGSGLDVTKFGSHGSHSKSFVKVGDTVQFRHSLSITKSGTVSDLRTVNYKFGGSKLKDNEAAKPGRVEIPPFSGLINTETTVYRYNENHVVTADDLEKGKVCRQISWSSKDDVKGEPTQAGSCIDVKADYTLTPSVEVDKSFALPGDVIQVTPKIERTGDPMHGANNWYYDFVYDDNTLGTVRPYLAQIVHSKNSLNTSDPYSKPYYTRIVNTGAKPLKKNAPSEYFEFPTPVKNGKYQYKIPANHELGSKICFRVTVSRWRPDVTAENYRHHSAEACVVIAKAPKAQVRGGSLIVPNGKVVGSTTTFENKKYGSWVEYDTVASGSVDPKVASSSGYGFLIGANENILPVDLQQLTFANQFSSNNNFGYFNDNMANFSHAFGAGLTNPYYYFESLAQSFNGSVIRPNNYGKGLKVIKHKSNAELPASTLGLGKQVVVIVEEGNLRITGDQKYSNAEIKSVSDIPQLVLIVKNGNIEINPDVTRIDGWLIAGSDKNNVTSSIKTCNVATPNAVNCSQELIINGPVMTDYLELHRTANSDVDLDNNVNTLARPAELFNFRPDAYIWAYNLGLGRASIQTTYLREMAPRY